MKMNRSESLSLLVILCTFLVATSLSPALAQQFTDLPLAPAATSVSTSCSEALNSTVSCPGFLGTVSVDNERLTAENLTSLCTDSCYESLQEVRETIAQGCTNTTTDVIEYDDVTYPATFVIDRFLYTYNLSCLRDSSTGDFCDTLLIDWLNEDSLTTEEACSDCLLGSDQLQLNSPFGYDEDYASEFASKTSSCNATGYGFTTPTSYAISSTTTNTSAVATATCTDSYTIQQNDTCNSIAAANNISTYSVLYRNGYMDSECDNLTAGSDICLGSACAVYQVQAEDNCTTILAAQASNVTMVQLLAWNPNLNSICGNLYNLKNTYICVGAPEGKEISVSSTTASVSSTTASASTSDSTVTAAASATTAVAKPTNALNASNSDCAEWYTVSSGDSCSLVSEEFGLSLGDFLFLNPEINSNCTNLLLGISYCVEAVGSITTYSAYPTTTAYYTLTSSNYSTASATPYTVYPGLVATTTSQLPVASGSWTNCSDYVNYVDVPAVQDQSDSDTSSTLTNYTNDCSFVTSTYSITLSEFLVWNPILSSGNCTLLPDYSYCVNVTGADYTTFVINDCVTPDVIKNGTVSSCSCFTEVFNYDNGSTYSCDNLVSDYSITLTELLEWNTWIGSDCDTGLYTFDNSTDINAVCIANNGTATSTSVSAGTSATVTSSQSATATCSQYYTVQSGDSCAAIESEYDITFAQLYEWNPSIGSSCEDLEVGVSYCVAGPTIATLTSTTSSATATTTTTTPTQTGITTSCTQYYTVQSGDSCSAIEAEYDVTFAELYEWNPSIGSDCEDLWVGYAICVAAS